MDILFAMGTSVLEGAALGVPAVIMPHNTDSFSRDEYVYLQNTKGFCLGWIDTQMEELGICGVPLKQILDDIYVYNRKQELSLAAYTYYEKNHQKNIRQFMDVIGSSKLRKLQLDKIHIQKKRHFKWLKMLFSVTNEDEYKVWTILGIKIKFRRSAD